MEYILSKNEREVSYFQKKDEGFA